MGFEVLYWVPYLQRVLHAERIDPARLILVTRGGAAAWYPQGGTSIELYDYLPPKDLRLMTLAAQQARASVKQFTITRLERKLLALITERIGVRGYHWLHPSEMYRALDPWWTTQKMGLSTAMQHLRVAPMPPAMLPLGMSLPERFVVMRWYQRATWPLREGLLDWTHQMVSAVAATIPVVILMSPQYTDDHVDFPVPPVHPKVTVIAPDPWRENLAVQTAILQKASAFVGTWGGVAQLAVRLGIPTVAFFDAWRGCSYQHRVMTDWLALQQGTPFFVGRPADTDQIRGLLPSGLAVPDPPKGSSS